MCDGFALSFARSRAGESSSMPQRKGEIMARPFASLIVVVALTTAASAQRRPFPEPIGYWGFDACSSTTSWDYAVTPHPATLTGGITCPPGQYGAGAYFNGTGLAEASGTTALNPATFTVAAWVKPDANSGWGAVVNKWYAMDSWAIWFNHSEYVFAVSFPNGSWGKPVAVSGAAPAGVWTHVAGVYDGHNVTLYLNGQRIISAPSPGGPPQASARPIAIGSHPQWDGFHGAIDEVRLYDHALDPADIQVLATPPSSVGVRGLHLYPDQYACAVNEGPNSFCPPNNPGLVQFNRDLDLIYSIGNLNSIKTTITTFKNDGNTANWLQEQNRKLVYLASATGGGKTWILRAAPTPADCPSPVTDYYACGSQFAHNLAPTLAQLASLHVADVYVEVANEPNWPDPNQIPFYTTNATQNMDRYNDFFRGFYFGQQAAGYHFPLVYAGLAPNCHDGRCFALDWYSYYWVRYHIANYAAKVGVHAYWWGLNPNDPDGRLGAQGGLLYRSVHDILADKSPNVYQVPRIGLQLTEFNFNKAATGSSFADQSREVCEWWQTLLSDAKIGYWTEQSTLFITANAHQADANEPAEYWFDDSQVAGVRDCR
jgi:hypothetical protein